MRPTIRTAACALACAGPFVTLVVARADDERPAPKSSSLSWIRLDGADACVATQPLARAVEARLGRAVFVSAAQAEVSIEGKIEAKKPGFRAKLILRDARGATLGTREIDSDGKPCDMMTEKLALVIALLIDPNALAPRPPVIDASVPDVDAPGDSGDEAATLDARAPIEPPPPPTTTAQPPAKEPLRFQGGAFVASAIGVLPHPGAGLGAGGLLHPPRFMGLEAYGAVYNPSTARGPTADVTVTYVHVAGSLCPGVHSGDLGFHLCVGQEIGAMLASTSNAATARDDTIPVWNFTLGARLLVPIVKPFGLRLALRGLVPVLRKRLVYTLGADSKDIYQPSFLAADGELGVGVYFP